MSKKITLGELFQNADTIANPFEGKRSTRLLALDVATHTGFCCDTASGVWNFTPKRDESAGMRVIRFKGKLKEICAIEGIRMIVFERVSGFHKNAIIVAAELIGVLKLFCEENQIEYKAYSAKEIKKFATGNGNANKAKMIEAARKYKANIESDDEADALHLYHYAIQDLNL
jgi:Holliday junction resolvasome RuvABC endonuclease subunit